ncbi:hypothetical protein EV175_005605 [Coemansia sp. RSA 1933]|nr:hypothetical protein EV175_005605 [Coemansia sp. RSA 1933]
MDNDMLYDESLNAQRMQDMEDWKRRMKAGSGDPHGELAQDSAIQEQPAQHALQGDASNGGIARGSRFLRLFSESTPQNVDGGLGIQENDPVLQQAQSYAYQNTANAAGIYANGVVLGGPEAQSIQGVDGSGDQISKLFKVLGDRISVNNPQMTGRTAIQNPENMLSSQNLTAAAAAVPPPPGINNTQNQQNMHPGSMATLNSSTVSAMSHPQGIPPAGNTAESREARVLASSTGQPTKVTTPEPHRIKTSSPAPINEALRGIVPTSVFRKSVQSGSGGSGAHSCSNSGGGRQNHRPESISSSRSGTPAKNLPSWLVELSRGRSASPTNNHTAAAAAGQAPVTNGSLGSQDLVDVLEREFPALGIRPQAADNQSISSLSVQASVGVPSEGTGGDSVRHSIIETREQETQQSSDAAAQVQVSEAASYQMMSSGIAATAAPGSSQAAADGSVMQNPGTITSPDPMQGMQHHVLPPQAMMEMAPPMIMPDGTMVPGGLMHHHHPQMMGGGQMPPMAMMPPPHHSMGFHPNMMFGMMPPPPPHPGMFGNVPQAGLSMSVGQLNGIPGPTSEHQQQMIKMMMMSDMPPPPPPPPAMMYGQMSAAGAPQQHPLQQNQHQQMQMQHMPPVHPAPNSHMYSAPMAQQQHPQAFNHPQQQQQQPYES